MAPAKSQHFGKARPSARADSDEIKTKIDLSHISKPGDVLKAIIGKQQTAAAASCAATARSRLPQRRSPAPAATRPACHLRRRPPVRSASACRGRLCPHRLRSSAAPPPMHRVRPCSLHLRRPRAASCCSRRASSAPQASAPQVHRAETASCRRSSAASSTQPQPPGPRMIVPQTGPRPVYKAPVPCRRAPAADAPRPGSRSPAVPRPGRPVPGQPIFQRPRPGARRTLPDRVRRCVPASAGPCIRRAAGSAGPRPIGVGPGLPPPGPTRPGSRPGGPSRRPGQRYVPRGVKEGPMKGFVPPPRLVGLE